MKIKIEINHKITGSILFEFESEGNTIANTVKEAIKSYANLSSADLSYANLSSANLSYANLSSANLRSANLRSANLRSADLSYANLSSANLRYADLRYANLRYANLRSANLRYADLRSANLRSADLSYANLSSADLRSIKTDFWDVLLRAKHEVAGLKEALINGKVDGSTYEGECACLVGTIANVKHCNFEEIELLKPDSSRPIERFFLGISKGDTHETNQISKIVLSWIEEFETLIKC